VKNGFKVIDTDTHVGPEVGVLQKFAGPELLARWDELKPYMREFGTGTHLSIGPYSFPRKMRQPAQESGATKGGTPALKGNIHTLMKQPAAPGVSSENAAGRLADMDLEGRDIDFIIPGTWSTAISAIDQELAKELYSAHHRYIAAYCATNPDRLKSTIVAPASDPDWAANEIKNLANEKWVASVTVVLPEGTPLDDPGLDPIWRVMNDNNLPIMHHSFFYEPPYFPGYRDIWGHVAVARSAAHIWGAQRLVAYAVMSGLFDEFENLRIGFAECSGGWLATWLVRLEGQAKYLSPSLPTLKHPVREYAMRDRVFCGIEPYEGEETMRATMEIIGDTAMMYQSDYPHDQCLFPETPDVMLGWNLPKETTQKLMAGNAERYLRLL
jgi:predicted TIM-barrel fold metal-dependent hydrolase